MEEERTSIVVIGAGVSGMSAARQLQKHNVKYVVVEARDRVGGRIVANTTHFGFPVDLGAQFIHHHKTNPLYDVARENGIPMSILEDKGDPYFVDPDGKVSNEYAQDQVVQLLKFMDDHVYSNFASLEQDTSFANAFEMSLRHAKRKLDPQVKRVWDAYINEFSAGYNAASVDEIGAKMFFDNGEHEGMSDDALLPTGMASVMQVLAKGLNIRLNHVVTRVEYTGRNVIVTMKGGKRIIADKVLVTVPLGVLKRNKIEFIPALPAKKSDAIKTIGYGSMVKVFLQFPESYQLSTAISCYIVLPSTDGKVIGCFALNWKKVTGKNVMILFFCGPTARDLKTQSPQALLSAAMKSMRTIDPKAPEPSKYLTTDWDNDDYSCGAYSYVGIGTSKQTFQDYRDPVNNKVYFAGEGTTSTLYGYAHGAYETGIQEANNMLTTLQINSRL